MTFQKIGGTFINTRLKLYNTSIEIVIDKKTKEKLRKVAFSKGITMSEYLRRLIKLSVISNDIKKLDDKFSICRDEFIKYVDLLGDKNVLEQ